MARKPIKRKAARDQKRAVNWKVIVGIVAAAVVFLGILMFASLNQQDSPEQVQQTGLIAYCDENPDNCAFTGSATAPVTLLEVFDFACIHCRNFNQENLPFFKSQYLNSGQVRFVTLPFASSPGTLPATNASLCAREQGAYFEYTSAMFSEFGGPDYGSRDQLLRAAAAVNLDSQQFSACIDEGRYNSVVSENVLYAQSLGVTSTPNFFINDVQVTGNQPQLIQQRIEAALAN